MVTCNINKNIHWRHEIKFENILISSGTFLLIRAFNNVIKDNWIANMFIRKVYFDIGHAANEIISVIFHREEAVNFQRNVFGHKKMFTFL